MRVNKRVQINKLSEIENALNTYSSDALFLAIQNLRKDDGLVKELEQLSYLLTDCQNKANSIIDALNSFNSARPFDKPTSQLQTDLQGADDEK